VIAINRSLIPSGNFYVAVSGGIDSIVALHLLHRIYKDRVFVCHINHKFQPANDDMEKSVAQFCKDFNIPLKVFYREDNDNIFTNVEDTLRNYRLLMRKYNT